MIDETLKSDWLSQAKAEFSDEERCLALLADLRWPGGVRCLKCESPRVARRSGRPVWLCRDCRKEFSVRFDTFMEGSPVELSKWLTAFWIVCAANSRVSSHDIHRLIGVTQKSAWFMLHRIRLAGGSQVSHFIGDLCEALAVNKAEIDLREEEWKQQRKNSHTLTGMAMRNIAQEEAAGRRIA